MKRRAVFLDRDGTLIEERNYLSDPDNVKLIDGAPEALKALAGAGFLLLMVTNQSGVARGYFTMEDVIKVNNQVEKLLERKGAYLDGAYVCPHYEKGVIPEYAIRCNCRKPRPGLALKAVKDWDLDLSMCYMIGDKLADVEFGLNIGAKSSYLVQTGHKIETNSNSGIIVKSIFEAGQDIISKVQVNK